MFLTRSEFTGR